MLENIPTNYAFYVMTDSWRVETNLLIFTHLEVQVKCEKVMNIHFSFSFLLELFSSTVGVTHYSERSNALLEAATSSSSSSSSSKTQKNKIKFFCILLKNLFFSFIRAFHQKFFSKVLFERRESFLSRFPTWYWWFPPWPRLASTAFECLWYIWGSEGWREGKSRRLARCSKDGI